MIGMGRILVTGGAGFIGSYVVRSLLERGDEVVVLDDFSGGTAEVVPQGVRVIEADIADPTTAETIERLAPDGVVHAAAQVSVVVSMEDPGRDRATNLLGTAHVLTGASRARVRRFVFLSSGGAVYGESDGADEQTRPAPASYYAVHKLAGEGYVALSGLSYAIARIANVYGAGQRSDLEGGVVAIFTERIARGEPLIIYGDGEQRRDFVHVSDVARAIITMLDAPQDGLWNVGTGVSTSVNELAETLRGSTAQPIRVNHAEERRGELRDSRLVVARIATDLGWQPARTLADGLSETLVAVR